MFKEILIWRLFSLALAKRKHKFRNLSLHLVANRSCDDIASQVAKIESHFIIAALRQVAVKHFALDQNKM